LEGAILRGTNLDAAVLDFANLEAVEIDSQTKANVSSSKRCRVDRYTLEAFDTFEGWKDTIDKVDLRIVDGLARLRSSFSGFWSWIHGIALAVFVFPYAFFLVRNWPGAEPARPSDGEEWTRVIYGLWHYIRSGGDGHGSGEPTAWWAVLIFAFLLVYNGLRFILLWKTKVLELEQEVTGLPARFSLRQRIWEVRFERAWWKWSPAWTWGGFYRLVKWGFRFNLVVVLVHTVIFLTHWIKV
jgi:hypothetical protein